MQNARQKETLEKLRGLGLHPETCWKAYPKRIPDNFIRDLGFGGICNLGFYFLEGVYHSTSGARLLGSSQAIKVNVRRLPHDALRFAVYSGLYSGFECGMAHARQKEDPWNSIIGGAAAFGALPLLRLRGALTLRQTLVKSAGSVLCGGVLIALFEGAVIWYNKKKVKANEDFGI